MMYLETVAKVGVVACLFLMASAQAFTPPFVLNEVAPGDYVHPGKNVTFTDVDHDDIANLGLVVGGKCAAVIDTGGSVTTGRAFLTAIRKVTDKPICYVISTHGHPDHIFGNSAFEHAGTVFVGSATLPADIQKKRASYLKAFADDLGPDPGAALVSPQKTVKVGHTLTLDLGARTLRLHAWPPAHTDTDLTVFDETTRTLFTGDLLFRERIPALDGNLDGWLKVLGVLAKFTPAPAVVVPGHGPVGHHMVKDLEPEQTYLQRLRKSTCNYVADGGDLTEASRKVMPDNDRHWVLWNQHQPLNVQRAFLELQWSCF